MIVALFYCRTSVFRTQIELRTYQLSQLGQRVPLYHGPTCFQFVAFSLLEILVNFIWLVYFEEFQFSVYSYVFDVINRWVLGFIPKF